MPNAKIVTEVSVDRVQNAAKYLSILLYLNKDNLKIVKKGVEELASITEQEVQVLAYAAVAGDLSTVKSRNGCLDYLKISKPTLNNAISKLQRVGVLVKTDRTRVHPGLQMDFSTNIILQINLNEQARYSKEGVTEARD